MATLTAAEEADLRAKLKLLEAAELDILAGRKVRETDIRGEKVVFQGISLVQVQAQIRDINCKLGEGAPRRVLSLAT